MMSLNSSENKPDFVHIVSVEDHTQHKAKLLYYIDQMIEEQDIDLNEKGYYYDFNIPKAHRPYKQLFKDITYPYLQTFAQTLGCNFSRMSSVWFQQYMQGSDFGWHQHGGHFAVVYYVELPDPNEATEFLQYGKFDVKEGDLLIFPTFMVHRSPEIKSNKRKTIIATNVYFEVDREVIEKHGKQHFRN